MRAKTKPHVNLSKDYQIVCGGEVAASFKSKGEAETALRVSFSARAGAFIAYPLGALNRDHLVAKQRKAAAKDTPADTQEIHGYLRRVTAPPPKPAPRVREIIEPVSFFMPRMQREIKDGDG